VDTNVTVRDGETVVIGGLITSRESEAENKVPIVGDIPGLGLLFRSRSVTKSKTELLVVLTVDILRTDDDMHQMSVEQRDKFVLPDSIRQSPLMEGLRIVPQDGQSLGPQKKEKGEAPETPAPTREERELYGPKPKTYGPPLPPPPTPTATSTAAAGVYGPKIAESGSGTASEESKPLPLPGGG
jgi:general secretion pathway protein D